MAGAEDQIIHRLLTAIDDDAAVSQRRLSSDVGIAVGSVNWYLKRCIKKGLIKFQHAPVKRYLYYLTPKGFEEKSRLTANFFQRSFELYRLGRRECAGFIAGCIAEGKMCIFLAGDGDLAEIACLSALGTPVQIKAVIDDDSDRASCAGVPVFANLAAAVASTGGEPPDAILLTNLRRPKTSYASMVSQARARSLAANVVHVPRILNFRPELENQLQVKSS